MNISTLTPFLLYLTQRRILHTGTSQPYLANRLHEGEQVDLSSVMRAIASAMSSVLSNPAPTSPGSQSYSRLKDVSFVRARSAFPSATVCRSSSSPRSTTCKVSDCRKDEEMLYLIEVMKAMSVMTDIAMILRMSNITRLKRSVQICRFNHYMLVG